MTSQMHIPDRDRVAYWKHHAIFQVWGQDTWILAKFVFRVLMDGEDSVDKNLISTTQ